MQTKWIYEPAPDVMPLIVNAFIEEYLPDDLSKIASRYYCASSPRLQKLALPRC